MTSPTDSSLSPAERVHDVPRILAALKKAVQEAVREPCRSGDCSFTDVASGTSYDSRAAITAASAISAWPALGVRDPLLTSASICSTNAFSILIAARV
jgi:hypothetical protein